MVGFGRAAEAWDAVVVNGHVEAGEVDMVAEVVDGSGCADVNGTDGATLWTAIASWLSAYNPLA